MQSRFVELHDPKQNYYRELDTLTSLAKPHLMIDIFIFMCLVCT